jgi:SAM-dependent methyltransferase
MRSAIEPQSNFTRLSAAAGASTSSWFSFWSRPAPIHVGERHLRARYRVTVDRFLAAFPDAAGKRMLDYGCGEALDAPRLAAFGMDVLLYDRSEYFHRRLLPRFAGANGIRVLDDIALGGLAPASIDHLLVCSVIQYLDRNELTALVRLAHGLLKPGGVLILADIIPTSLDTMADTLDFLAYSIRHRFFFSGLRTLFDMVMTNYRSHLRENNLARYDLDELSALLGRHDLVPSLADRNIGISRARKTLLAQKPA